MNINYKQFFFHPHLVSFSFTVNKDLSSFSFRLILKNVSFFILYLNASAKEYSNIFIPFLSFFFSFSLFNKTHWARLVNFSFLVREQWVKVNTARVYGRRFCVKYNSNAPPLRAREEKKEGPRKRDNLELSGLLTEEERRHPFDEIKLHCSLRRRMWSALLSLPYVRVLIWCWLSAN